MANTMNLEEYLKELKEAGKDGTSMYNLRNESVQLKNRVASIRRFKKELKKKSKLCIAMELAIPFDPLTGTATETYNADKKFRPHKTATSVALMIKAMAAQNEEVKQIYMQKAGVTEWDTSDISTFTDTDRAIFIRYRVPSVYTFPVVTVDIPAMTGEYSRDYMINIKRDPITGQVIGKKPIVLQAFDFFRSVCFEEVQSLTDDRNKGKITLTEKQFKEKRSDIWGKNPIRDDHPANYIVAVELPMNTQYSLDSTYPDLNVDAFKDLLVYTKETKSLRISIDKYQSGEWSKFDKHFDYVEVDVVCPAEGATPAEIGQGTTYEKPSSTLDNELDLAKFDSIFTEYFDSTDEMENIMINSVRISKYDESVEALLCSALPSIIDVESPFLTKKVIEHNKEFITVALGDTGTELLLDLEIDSGARSEGQLDDAKAAEMSKEIAAEISLEDALNEELPDLDVIE